MKAPPGFDRSSRRHFDRPPKLARVLSRYQANQNQVSQLRKTTVCLMSWWEGLHPLNAIMSKRLAPCSFYTTV